MQDPIIIVGCPRSGTSWVGGQINKFAFGGDLIAGNNDNPQGYFENHAIRDGVNKPILKELGADISGVNSFPSDDQVSSYPLVREELQNIIKEQGYKEGLWFFKDCKILWLLDIYLKSFPKARWVIVRRDRDGIVRSCLRTGFMRRHGNEHFFYQLVDKYESQIDKLKQILEGDFYEINPFESKVDAEYFTQ